MTRDYSSLRDSINSAVDEYEQYKSQVDDIDVSSISITPQKSPAVSQQRSASWPQTAPGGDYSAFIAVAENYESATYLIDLDFTISVVEFMQREHPHTNASLQKAIKVRTTEKRSLWQAYTREMQGLARAYTSGKSLPVPSSTSPLSANHDTKDRIRSSRKQVTSMINKLDSEERTSAESLFGALTHLHAQAIKDIKERYAMPDPINDKTTSVNKHNHRIRDYNKLIRFVKDDLQKIERSLMNGAHKSSKKPGVTEAIESLSIEEYPPYK